MKSLENDIKELNELSLIRYLEILGFTPVGRYPERTEYEIGLSEEFLTIVVDHATNRFLDKLNNRGGTLVDFGCLLFECAPVELCNNIVPYGIYRLMSESPQFEAAHS